MRGIVSNPGMKRKKTDAAGVIPESAIALIRDLATRLDCGRGWYKIPAHEGILNGGCL